MNYLLIFFTSLIFTIFFTPYFIAYLKKSNVVDLPGKRRIHNEVIPRMGGLLIFMMASVMIISFYKDLNSIRLIIISANIILLVGIFDDMLGLEYSIKFLLQTLASVLLLIYLAPRYDSIRLFEVYIPFPFDYVVLVMFILGSINSINLLDGMDGLVSGFSLLVFSIILSLAILSYDTFLLILSCSLMGSIFGFLKFNAFPAKIFLGDTGSLSLGFFLVVASLLTSINYNNGVLDLSFPAMLMAVPVADTVRVMITRIIRGKNPFLPDNTHLHHIISAKNISHKFTVFVIESLTVLFILLALYYIKYDRVVPLALFAFLILLLLFIEPILNRIRPVLRMTRKIEPIRSIPNKYFQYAEKLLIIFSSLMISVIVFSSFPRSSTLNKQVLILFFVIGIILLFLAYGHQKRSRDLSDIYTFINLSAFFTITNLNTHAVMNYLMPSISGNRIIEMSYYFLAVIIILFILGGEKLFSVKRMILNGVDLTVVVFILLTIVVNSFIRFDFDNYFSTSFLQAFIFYLWYKVIVTVKSNMANYLFYASFALPFAAILFLMFN